MTVIYKFPGKNYEEPSELLRLNEINNHLIRTALMDLRMCLNAA